MNAQKFETYIHLSKGSPISRAIFEPIAVNMCPHPGVGTELLIDRRGEVAAQGVARELGLDGTFIYEDPKRGWKISKFIPNCRNIDPHNRSSGQDNADGTRAARVWRRG